MQRLWRTLSAVALTAVAAGATFADGNGGAARAEEVLKQARAAVGGEEKLRGVQTLTVKGKFRRVMGEREMSGEREYDFQLPDSYLRTESLSLPGMATSVTTERAFSRGQFWTNGGGGRAGGFVIMRGLDGQEPTPEQKAKMEQEQARQTRAEMARYVLALLLSAPADFPLQFNYAGEATADDGAADVIDATGPDGFSVRLFVDKQTHLPLMLAYRAPKPRVMTMTMRADGHGGGGKPAKTPEELAKEAQEKMKAEGPPKPEEVEMQVRFEDYRESGGLMLPHRITSGFGGETSEEFEVKSYALNPRFKADKFQKK